MPTISSPAASGCSRCGVSPGSRKKSSKAMSRSPSRLTVCTTASNAASATATSDGCVAMQCSLVPRIACPRLKPVERGAAAPGVALVAGGDPVAQVRAARALEQVAAHRGHVAQLLGGAEVQRLGDRREALDHPRLAGDVAHARERADAQTAVGERLDARERQVVDVDEVIVVGDAGADEVDLGRPAGQERAARVPGGERERLLHRRGAAVAQRLHGASRTCRIAARMLGYAAQRHRLPLMNSAMSSSVEALPSSSSLTADMIWPGVQ